MNENQQDKLRKEFISLGKDLEKLLKASEDFEKKLNRKFEIYKKAAEYAKEHSTDTHSYWLVMRTYIDGFNDCKKMIKKLNDEKMILQKNKKTC